MERERDVPKQRSDVLKKTNVIHSVLAVFMVRCLRQELRC